MQKYFLLQSKENASFLPVNEDLYLLTLISELSTVKFASSCQWELSIMMVSFIDFVWTNAKTDSRTDNNMIGIYFCCKLMSMCVLHNEPAITNQNSEVSKT